MIAKKKKCELELYMNRCVIPILEAQNKVYGPHDHSFLTSLIKQNNIKRVLDVGTGDGSFILELSQKTPDVKYHAIDASEELINHAQKNKKRLNNKSVKFSSVFASVKCRVLGI